MADDVEDFLAHYGVLGMHWGQRKSGSVSTTSRGASRAGHPNGIKERFQNHIHTTSKARLAGEATAVVVSAAALARGASFARLYGPAAIGTLRLVGHAVSARNAASFVNELTRGPAGLIAVKTIKGVYQVSHM